MYILYCLIITLFLQLLLCYYYFVIILIHVLIGLISVFVFAGIGQNAGRK